MKRHIPISLALLLVFILASCVDTSSLMSSDSPDVTVSPMVPSKTTNNEKIHDYYTIDDNETDIAALFFVGYDGNYGRGFEIGKFRLQMKYFLNLENQWPKNIETVIEEGDENFLVLPKYENTTITVHKIEWDEDTWENYPTVELITTNRPVLLKCNVSDLFPSTQITIRYKDEEIIFNPYVNLEDGYPLIEKKVYTEEYSENIELNTSFLFLVGKPFSYFNEVFGWRFDDLNFNKDLSKGKYESNNTKYIFSNAEIHTQITGGMPCTTLLIPYTELFNGIEQGKLTKDNIMKSIVNYSAKSREFVEVNNHLIIYFSDTITIDFEISETDEIETEVRLLLK